MVLTILTLPNEFPLTFGFRLILSGCLFALCLNISKKLNKKRKIDKRTRVLFNTLSAYYIVMLYYTALGRYSQKFYQFEPVLFASYERLFSDFAYADFMQILRNLLMFIPVAILLCEIVKGKLKYLWVMLISFAMSLFIESLQYIMRCGMFEVDDLLNNFVSTLLGIVIYLIYIFIYNKCKKKKGLRK